MKLNNVYIISWFGNDASLVERRKAIHEKQLEWAAAHKLNPIVLAQGYKKNDYVDGVTYIKPKTKKILLPGNARNLLLKHFYKSGEDFAVFADNDTILYEDTQHGDSARFVEILRGMDIADFEKIDLIVAQNPSRNAFRTELRNTLYKKNLLFRRTYKMNGAMFFLKNLKTYHSKELYFDEVNFEKDGKLITGEDCDFVVNALHNGLGCYHTFCAIFNEMARSHSTWAENVEERRVANDALPLMNAKYGKELFTFSDLTANKHKAFSAVGHSRSLEGRLKLRFAVDREWRHNQLVHYQEQDITFYDLPEPMSVPDALDYTKKSRFYKKDATLRDLVDKATKSVGTGKQCVTRRGKPKSKFNWDVLDTKIPARLELVKPKKYHK
jgi:hypothetical protein